MKKLKVVKGAKCMACLECVRACSTSFYKEFDPDKSCIQIVEKKGDAKQKKCTGCGKCVEACPFGVMVKAEDSPVSTKCIACGICAKACPADVLEVVEA